MPTRAPSVANANARFTASVDLPTPPFPEATGIIFLMWLTPLIPGCPTCGSIFQEILTIISIFNTDNNFFIAEISSALKPSAG